MHSSITNTFLRYRHIFSGSILLSLLWVHPALAADPAGTGSTITDFNWLITVLTLIQSVLSALGFLALSAAEYFLRPEFLNGTLTSNGRIHEVWMLMRDIVNIIFAVMLIGVAMYTITMGSSAKVKEYIVYFILAVVLVNLSWFFPRVIIDVSHVLTATVYQIPSALPSVDRTKCLNGETCSMITHVTLWPDQSETVQCKGQHTEHVENNDPNDCQCIPISETESIACYDIQPFDVTTAAGAHAMLNGLAVNYGRLSSIGKVQRTSSDDPPAGAPIGPQLDLRFFVNVLFSLVFSIFMIFPLIALAAGLAIRILVLVFCIALMPFTFIGFVLNKGKLGTNVFGIDFDVWNEFIMAAFVPFFVACVLSLGFIFLNASLITPSSGPNGVTINYFVNGISNWQTLLSVIFAMMIIWTGVFAAFSKSKLISPITNKIKTYGQQWGSVALKAPLLIPLPTPGGGRIGDVAKLLSPSHQLYEIEKKLSGGVAESDVKKASDSFRENKDGSHTKIENALSELKKPGLSEKERTEALDRIRKILEDNGIRNARTMDEATLKSTIDSISSQSGRRYDTSSLNRPTGSTSVVVERDGDSIVVEVGGEKKSPITKDMQNQLLENGAHTVLDSVGIGANAQAAQKVYEEMANHARTSGDTAGAAKADKIAGALRSLPAGSSPDDVKKAIEDSLRP